MWYSEVIMNIFSFLLPFIPLFTSLSFTCSHHCASTFPEVQVAVKGLYKCENAMPTSACEYIIYIIGPFFWDRLLMQKHYIFISDFDQLRN